MAPTESVIKSVRGSLLGASCPSGPGARPVRHAINAVVPAASQSSGPSRPKGRSLGRAWVEIMEAVTLKSILYILGTLGINYWHSWLSWH